MERLHAGDHAEFPESRDILGARIFDVLDPVSCIRATICFMCSFVCVKGKTNGAITDSMREDREAEKREHEDRHRPADEGTDNEPGHEVAASLAIRPFSVSSFMNKAMELPSRCTGLV